jgi:hypothetical protein
VADAAALADVVEPLIEDGDCVAELDAVDDFIDDTIEDAACFCRKERRVKDLLPHRANHNYQRGQG